jgi:hypothetical protein
MLTLCNSLALQTWLIFLLTESIDENLQLSLYEPWHLNSHTCTYNRGTFGIKKVLSQPPWNVTMMYISGTIQFRIFLMVSSQNRPLTTRGSYKTNDSVYDVRQLWKWCRGVYKVHGKIEDHESRVLKQGIIPQVGIINWIFLRMQFGNITAWCQCVDHGKCQANRVRIQKLSWLMNNSFEQIWRSVNFQGTQLVFSKTKSNII